MKTVNFQTIISDLQKAGFTQTEIAEKIGVKQSTVCSLLKGDTKEPRFFAGDSLISLHREICGDQEGSVFDSIFPWTKW